MNVLLVDDQKAIVESLKKGIHWENLPVRQVYTACSAKEAKLVLRNFEVDVLVSDIEMPEENGLSLCRWAKEQFQEIECIFLTSHADFAYAKEAIAMGGFDYVLQPVKYREVEAVLLKAWDKISSRKKLRRLENTRKLVIEQRNTILDAMLSKMLRDKGEEADQIYRHFAEMFRMEYDNCTVHPVLVQILKWKRLSDTWEENLVRMTLCNIAEELFEDRDVRAGISCLREDRYWLFLVAEKGAVGDDLWHRRLKEFYSFVNENMDFSVGVYPIAELEEDLTFSQVFGRLGRRAEGNKEKKPGIYWENVETVGHAEETNPIDTAVSYIRKNLSKNISRAEVAELVHLNEEYFSRLFRQETGDTFKDFVLLEKMKAAKKLLAETHLSVSIVASKVGYDNFSHFSKMFKKMTEVTPQEYRKDRQKR